MMALASKDLRIIGTAVLSTVSGIVGNQVAFEKFDIDTPTSRWIVVAIALLTLGAAVLAMATSRDEFSPESDASRWATGPPLGERILGIKTGPKARRRRPLPARDGLIVQLLLVATFLGAAGLWIWPFVVSNQAHHGPAATVKVSHAVADPDQPALEHIEVKGTIRRPPKSGNSYWLMQRLHYDGSPVTDDEFYPKAKLKTAGKYHIDLTYTLDVSPKSAQRKVYVAQFPDAMSADLVELISRADAYQDEPCDTCTVSGHVSLTL